MANKCRANQLAREHAGAFVPGKCQAGFDFLLSPVTTHLRENEPEGNDRGSEANPLLLRRTDTSIDDD